MFFKISQLSRKRTANSTDSDGESKQSEDSSANEENIREPPKKSLRSLRANLRAKTGT